MKVAFDYLRGNENWNCSNGYYAAVKKMIDEYKLTHPNQ